MFELHEVLWCREDGHDKIWVGFAYNDVAMCAWGRRTGRLNFKRHSSSCAVAELADKKKRKGYRPIAKQHVEANFPGLVERIEADLVLKLMADGVK